MLASLEAAHPAQAADTAPAGNSGTADATNRASAMAEVLVLADTKRTIIVSAASKS